MDGAKERARRALQRRIILEQSGTARAAISNAVTARRVMVDVAASVAGPALHGQLDEIIDLLCDRE